MYCFSFLCLWTEELCKFSAGGSSVSIPGQARRTPIKRKIIEENREVGRSEKGACWVYPVDMLAIMEVQEMVVQVRVPGASSEETTGFTLDIRGTHECQAIGSQGLYQDEPRDISFSDVLTVCVALASRSGCNSPGELWVIILSRKHSMSTVCFCCQCIRENSSPSSPYALFTKTKDT